MNRPSLKWELVGISVFYLLVVAGVVAANSHSVPMSNRYDSGTNVQAVADNRDGAATGREPVQGGTLGGPGQGAQYPRPRKPGELSLRQVLKHHGLVEKLEPILDILKVPIDSGIFYVSPEYELGMQGSWDFMLLDKTMIDIDFVLGRITSYSPRNVEALPEGAIPEPLSKEQCEEKAYAFLRALGYNPEMDFINMKTHTGDITPRIMKVTPGKEPPPPPKLYTIAADHAYKGVLGGFIRVVVSAHTGNIVKFMDIPLVPPKSTEPEVSSVGALEKAKVFVAAQYFRNTALRDIKFRWRPPTLQIQSSEECKIGYGQYQRTLGEGRMVWYISLNASSPEVESDICFFVIMDAQTGEILNKMSAMSSVD